MIAGLLLERNDIGEIDWRHSGERALHELQPNRQRGARAGFFFAKRNLLVVEANPDAAGDLRREADEPRVGVILCRTRLTGRRTT